MKRRSLTDDEKEIWERITRLDAPLNARPKHIPEVKRPLFFETPRRYTDTPSMNEMPGAYAALESGAYAGIDRNTAERFRKGERAFDGTLDLHGMTREKARAALHVFILGHYERGSRCLLVITGKGAGAQGGGVIRASLPQWLAEPALRPMVLALDGAQAKHGGSGAYYVLLRRARHGQ